MRFHALLGVGFALIALLVGGWLISLRHPAVPDVSPAREAEHMTLEAGVLKDSADKLRAGGLHSAADELDARAGDLTAQAALLRQTEPMPARQMAEEFIAKSRSLSDSAQRLRNAFLTRNDSLTRLQELLVARIERKAADLRALGRRISSWGLSTREQKDIYRTCIMTYGEGAASCELLRQDAPDGP
jgi:hypothetical protein